MRKQFLIRLFVTAVLAWGVSVVVSNDTWTFFCIDSINNVGSQARVNFGGANQPKGSEERSRTC
jgi:hypothetical protein